MLYIQVAWWAAVGGGGGGITAAVKTPTPDGHPSLGQPCTLGVSYEAHVYWTGECRTQITRHEVHCSVTSGSNPFGDGCGVRDKEMGRKHWGGAWMGCTQRCQHMGCDISLLKPYPGHPFRNCMAVSHALEPHPLDTSPCLNWQGVLDPRLRS